MKKRMIAWLLTTVVAISGITWTDISQTTVYAEETDNIVRDDGLVLEMRSKNIAMVNPTLINPMEGEELSVGGDFYGSLSVVNGQGNPLIYGEAWDFVDEFALSEMGIRTRFYSDYDSIEKAIDDSPQNTFQGTIPAAAFGKYIYHMIYVSQIDQNHQISDGCEGVFKFVRSKYTVTDWGGTDYQTFSLNDDKKTVTVFSIFDSKEPFQASFQKYITVAGKRYKVTSIGSWALDGTYGSGGLTDLSLHSGITSIGENAFKNASKLKTIKIEGNVKKVGKAAFSGINKKAVFKIKASKKNYDKIVKLIKKSGVPKTVTFKRVK